MKEPGHLGPGFFSIGSIFDELLWFCRPSPG